MIGRVSLAREHDADALDHLADTRHPWHAYPYYGAAGVVFVPLFIVGAPFTLLEPGEPNMHNSKVIGFVGQSALAVGAAVGGVFYVVGYPLEWVFPVDPRGGLPPIQDPRNPTPERE